MQKDNAIAQAATLREWSDQWQRAAIGGGAEGCGEVSFLLLRVSRLIEGVVGAAPRPAPIPVEETLRPAPATVEVREG